jgi:tetratricopeptide (TPR) repeat protein
VNRAAGTLVVAVLFSLPGVPAWPQQPEPAPTSPTSAATGATAPAAASSVAEAPTDERVATYREFRAAFDARDYAAARVAAERLVALTEARYRADSRELVNPLSNLGTVHYRLGDYAAAELAFARAVRIVDGQLAGADRALIRPLQGLGETYLATRQYAESAASLKRAVDLMRNLDGLFTVEQLETLDSLIEAYIALDRLQDAEKESQYAFRVAESAWGRNDLRLLDPLDRLAHWYERVGRYTTARGLYARALQLAESQAGRGSVLTVAALRGLARTYYLEFLYGPEDQEAAHNDPLAPAGPSNEGRLNPDGERALRLALDALARQRPPDATARAATLIELGDWYLISGATSRAHEAYRQGWNEATVAGADARTPLTAPRRLAYRPPSISVSRASPSRPEEFEERFVEVRFTVGADGRVSGVETAATDAPPAAERAVAFAVRKARYAPRLENGEPVATTGVLLRERVLVRRANAAPADSSPAEQTPGST